MKKITQEDLDKRLRLHGIWLESHTGGKRLDLSNHDLSGADLVYADLTFSNLRYADLNRANLMCARLSGAHLKGANLTSANLTCANFTCANLDGAYLQYADLRYAIFRCANLEGAYIQDVDLTHARIENICIKHIKMPIEDMYFHKSNKYIKGNILNIGCESHSIQHWLDNYIEIGESSYGYFEEMIEEYGEAIKLLESEL